MKNGCAQRAEDVVVDPTMRVVSVSIAEECTGMGGQYLLMSESGTGATYVAGGHGCHGVDEAVHPPSGLTFGLVRAGGPVGEAHLGPCVRVDLTRKGPAMKTPVVSEIVLVGSEAEARALLRAATAGATSSVGVP